MRRTNTPGILLGDAISLLCVFLLGALCALGGATYGIAHCTQNHCAGYETVESGQ